MFSVVIVTFNSRAIIGKCLDSLLSLKPRSEIIVVDNASKDGTFEEVKSRYGGVHIISNKKNLGFTKGCNQGARAASGKYILFLNPDTEIVSRDIFQRLRNFLPKHMDLGAVGFKFLNRDKSLQPSCGFFPTFPRILADRMKLVNNSWGFLIRKKGFYRKTQPVDWVSGSGLLVERQSFLALGGFDEGIFMYGEDYELCFRLKKLGLKNYLFPKVIIMHQDTGKNNPLRKPHKYYSMRKGLLYFFKKYQKYIDYFLLAKTIKFESLFFLGALPFRNKAPMEKGLWKNFLMQSLRL